MKLRTMAIVAPMLVLLSTAAAVAGTVTIDFDDGVDGATLGDSYAGSGVTFGYGQGDGEARWFDLGLSEVGMSGTFLIVHGTLGGSPTAADPIVGLFDVPVYEASIVGLDVGVNGARMDAYDARFDGNLVDFDQAIGTGLGSFAEPFTLRVSGLGIRRIELYLVMPAPGTPLSPYDSAAWDSLSFSVGSNLNPASVVPLPSMAWAGLGMLCLLGVARRRRLRRG